MAKPLVLPNSEKTVLMLATNFPPWRSQGQLVSASRPVSIHRRSTASTVSVSMPSYAMAALDEMRLLLRQSMRLSDRLQLKIQMRSN